MVINPFLYAISSIQPTIIPCLSSIVLINKEESNVKVDDYLSYLDRISIEYLGMGKDKVYYSLQGLKTLGLEVPHKVLKSVVFHLINEVKKGGI